MGEVIKEVAKEGLCPIIFVNKKENIKNHIKTVKEAKLGPASPSKPETQFWMEKAKLWKVSPAEAKTRLCSNCGLYLNTKQIKECYSAGVENKTIPLATEINPSWENTTDGAAFCLKFDITCTASRTCDDWIAGGPLTEQNLR
jgi:hypothetical protein